MRRLVQQHPGSEKLAARKAMDATRGLASEQEECFHAPPHLFHALEPKSLTLSQDVVASSSAHILFWATRGAACQTEIGLSRDDH
jgi:hypothetical protein